MKLACLLVPLLLPILAGCDREPDMADRDWSKMFPARELPPPKPLSKWEQRELSRIETKARAERLASLRAAAPKAKEKEPTPSSFATGRGNGFPGTPGIGGGSEPESTPAFGGGTAPANGPVSPPFGQAAGSSPGHGNNPGFRSGPGYTSPPGAPSYSPPGGAPRGGTGPTRFGG